jgi:peptidylprolyl isomerase
MRRRWILQAVASAAALLAGVAPPGAWAQSAAPSPSSGAVAAQPAGSAPAAAPPATPSQIVAAAPASDWVTIDPADVLVMTLAPDAAGAERRVVIQLIAAPLSEGWTANIRTLARAHWWDGLSINRVQDNYVAQWGDADGEDAAKAKRLPPGLHATAESGYVVPVDARLPGLGGSGVLTSAVDRMLAAQRGEVTASRDIPGGWMADAYAAAAGFYHGWPVATDRRAIWPTHCYGTVGVGRGLSPDAGSGAELYAVIGHAPRHLDANIAVVGRVIEGIEYLSSLPRGTGGLGFYEQPSQRVAIRSIRLASDLPPAEQPRFQYLSTESQSFARYAHARANRHDDFFIRPAGGVDVCNVPVPVRRTPAS